MSKAVEIEGYMLRVHTRHYDKVNGVIVCYKGENDKMFFPFRRPQGEWEFIGENLYMCTECGYKANANWLSEWKEYTTDSEFPCACPNCGAKMKEGEEK